MAKAPSAEQQEIEKAERVVIDHVRDSVVKHEALKALKADLDAQIEIEADKIKAAMGEYVVGTIDGVDRILLPFRTRSGGLNGDVVKAEDPALYLKAKKPDTGYRPLLHVAKEVEAS